MKTNDLAVTRARRSRPSGSVPCYAVAGTQSGLTMQLFVVVPTPEKQQPYYKQRTGNDQDF